MANEIEVLIMLNIPPEKFISSLIKSSLVRNVAEAYNKKNQAQKKNQIYLNYGTLPSSSPPSLFSTFPSSPPPFPPLSLPSPPLSPLSPPPSPPPFPHPSFPSSYYFCFF